MSLLEQLAGHIQLVPARAWPHNVLRQRPGALAQVLSQQSADGWPQRVGAVFAMCGHAQRDTAGRAIAAARGELAAPTPPERTQLRWHTARDHVRFLLLDMAVQTDAAGAAQALATCPLFRASQPAQALEPLASWLTQQLLGQPPKVWLRAFEQNPQGWLDDWAATHPGPAAAWLRGLRTFALALRLPCHPVRLHADVQAQSALAAQLAQACDEPPDQALAPLVAQGLETGAWARQQECDALIDTLWLRLGYRIRDLARLALDDHDQWLCCGAVAVGPHEGLAWSETARGLLVHWVRLAGAQVVRFRIVSPTDWNFHPQGVVARALGGLSLAQARCLAQAFDPCVPLKIIAEEAVDA